MPRRTIKPPTSPLTDRTSGRSVHRAPAAATTRLRRYTLAIEQVRPVIRIAHRIAGPLNIPRRVIVDFEIVFVARGQTALVASNSTPLRAGSLVLIPPFVEHAFASRAGAAVEHVGVHFDLSPDVPGTHAAARSAAYRVELSRGQALPACVPVVAGAAVRSSLDRLVEAFAERTPAAELEASSLLAALLAKLMGQSSQPREGDAHRWRLQRLLDYIDAHLAEPLGSDALAAQLALSPSRFRAVFGRLMGLSPHQYVTRRRIALARKLLVDDAYTIKQIARLTGFADEFHFSKTFRNVDGLPPSVYRTQAQASRI